MQLAKYSLLTGVENKVSMVQYSRKKFIFLRLLESLRNCLQGYSESFSIQACSPKMFFLFCFVFSTQQLKLQMQSKVQFCRLYWKHSGTTNSESCPASFPIPVSLQRRFYLQFSLRFLCISVFSTSLLSL